MKLTALALLFLLTGCATPPSFLANMYDRNDPCQKRAELNRPAGYEIPSFCGAGGSRAKILNTQHQVIGYVK